MNRTATQKGDSAACDTWPDEPKATGYSWYVLSVLVIVYILNFIDRQILSILAIDVQAHLNLSHQQMGFLGGAAFAVFYALFGLPFGRLADNWSRTKLLSLGLALWSAMTALSGLAKNGLTLGVARMGVGIGEATASPCAYSLLSDYFPKRQRATAFAIYASGIYIGAGASLFIGASINQAWNAAYPGGGPLGLVGWQAAFLAVGLPGLLLALWVLSLREPVRGVMDGLTAEASPTPFADFARELTLIVPPLTLISAARRGPAALAINVAAGAIAIASAWCLIGLTGNVPQWSAIAVGYYAVFSWASALRANDRPTFELIWGTPAFLCTTLAYGVIAMSSNGLAFWTAPYAETVLGLAKKDLAFWIGGGAAVGGFLGIVLGGRAADAVRARLSNGRVLLMMFSVLAPIIPIWIAYTTADKWLFYFFSFLANMLGSMGLGAAAATTQDLVLPRMRGTATAAFFLGTTLIGLAFGPYLVGLIAELAATSVAGNILPDLRTGLLAMTVLAVPTMVLLWTVWRTLPVAEATVRQRATDVGESEDS